jgi:hypothetical protein
MGKSVNKRLDDLEKKALADHAAPANKQFDSSRLTPEEYQRWLELRKIDLKSRSREKVDEWLRLYMKALGFGNGLMPGGAPPGLGVA